VNRVYTVTLSVVDTSGNLSTASRQVIVGIPPTAGFVVRPAHPATGLPVSFNASLSRAQGGSIAAYAWTFGDGSAGSGVAPRHLYRRPGRYAVTLTVTDGSRLPASATRTIQVAIAATITRTGTRSTRQGTSVVVSVNGPGVVSARSRSIRLLRAGTATFKISLTAGERRTLAVQHRVKINVKVKFVPLAGNPSARTVTIILRS
jgi:PKD repeat protein